MNEATGRACPDHSTDSTAWITIVDWPGGRLDVFDELDSTHQDDLHVGVLSRYCCQQPDGPAHRRHLGVPGRRGTGYQVTLTDGQQKDVHVVVGAWKCDGAPPVRW
ncbi:MAG TPA: hypothetical protein VF942_10775, partial [Acidimicrobiales bacterium]